MTHTHIQTPRDTPAEPGCPDVPRGPTITQAHADTPHRPAHTQHSIRLTLCRDTPALRRGSGQAPVAMGRPGPPHPLQPGGPCPHQARPRPAPTGSPAHLVKRTSQMLHMYGFSPVWVLMCRGSFPAPMMTLWQMGHC